MVEVVNAMLDYKLNAPLAFTLTKTASKISKKRSCTVHRQRGNIYSSSNGQRHIHTLQSAFDWLDPSTVSPIMFDEQKHSRIVIWTYYLSNLWSVVLL